MKYRFPGIFGCFLLLTGCNYIAISSNELSASNDYDYSDQLASVSNLNNFQSFNGDGITGAQIDENQIKRTIHVDINHYGASDKDLGLQENPFKSFSAALEKAKQYLRQGKSTKIVIHPGVYREGELVIDGNDLGSEAKNALLVIEGITKGQVILSGSEELKPETWQQAGSYFQHDWLYDFGNRGGAWGKANPKKVIAHRSEMVFINGKPLKQILLEKYNYTWPDNWSGRGNHKYIGFDAPQNALKSNTFGVAELDENGNKIYIRPSDGVNFANAKIEVATKRFILRLLQMDNVVLRNLNFQHTTGDIEVGAAVVFGPWWGKNEFKGSNILIEDCDFRWNNATGLSLWQTKNVTLRRNTSNYNGFMGVGGWSLMDTVWEDNETSFNNWRGYMDDWAGWSIGGAKLVNVRGGVFRRHRSIGNMTRGLWFDIGSRNILIEDLTSIHNIRGLFLEISPGPFVVRKALLADDQEVNFLVNNATNILMENSIVHGVSGYDPVQFTSYQRTFDDKVGKILGENNAQKTSIVLGKTEFRNNVIVAEDNNPALIVQQTGDPKMYRKFLEQDYAGTNNVYWATQDKVFGLGFQRHEMTDIQGWADFTKEANSQWMDPQFVDSGNYDFRLKQSSPLKDREDSLPTRSLSSSKVQELRDFINWLD